jgi:hypothetical protein
VLFSRCRDLPPSRRDYAVQRLRRELGDVPQRVNAPLIR